MRWSLLCFVCLLGVTSCGAEKRPPGAAVSDAPASSATTSHPTSSHATTNPRRFKVYKGDVLELEIVDRPGLLMSNSAPPPVPGSPPPPLHPFLSATAFVATDEGELRKLLDASSSLEEFLGKLRAKGLRVEEVP